MAWPVRALVPGDAPAAAALIHEAFAAQPVATDPPPGALRETVEGVAAHIAGHGGVAAEGAGALAGVVLWAVRDQGLYLSRLAVPPRWRRQSIARALVAAAEAEALRLGLPRVHLGVRLALADNRRLFASCGFQEGMVSCHPGYSEPTTVAMEKWLLAGPAFPPLPQAGEGERLSRR